MANKRRAYVAYHEAGHAFADFTFRHRVKKATIVPCKKDSSAGHVISKTGLHFRSLDYENPSASRIGRLHERVVCLLAGRAAQRIYDPASVRPWHARSDIDEVMNLLYKIHSSNELKHVFRYLDARAKNLVEHPRNRFVIRHLAGELMKRKTMTGKEVEQAIGDGYALHSAKQQGKRPH